MSLIDGLCRPLLRDDVRLDPERDAGLALLLALLAAVLCPRGERAVEAEPRHAPTV